MEEPAIGDLRAVAGAGAGRRASPRERVARRLRWYWARLRVNNRTVGRLIEVLGDRVRLDGLKYSLATPQVSTPHKSTIAFGLHEIEERRLVKRWLPPDLPLIECGGGLGVVSCLANRKLADRTRHVVLEANPAMIEVLTRNRDLNRCKFEILNRAIAYDAAEVRLAIDSEFVGSTVAGEPAGGPTIVVPATSLRAEMDARGFDRCAIIADIEGAEADMIEKDILPLGERASWLMLEMHPTILGEARVEGLLAQLRGAGFHEQERLGTCVAMSRERSPAPGTART